VAAYRERRTCIVHALPAAPRLLDADAVAVHSEQRGPVQHSHSLCVTRRSVDEAHFPASMASACISSVLLGGVASLPARAARGVTRVAPAPRRMRVVSLASNDAAVPFTSAPAMVRPCPSPRRDAAATPSSTRRASTQGCSGPSRPSPHPNRGTADTCISHSLSPQEAHLDRPRSLLPSPAGPGQRRSRTGPRASTRRSNGRATRVQAQCAVSEPLQLSRTQENPDHWAMPGMT
jgi:hypothetical protein